MTAKPRHRTAAKPVAPATPAATVKSTSSAESAFFVRWEPAQDAQPGGVRDGADRMLAARLNGAVRAGDRHARKTADDSVWDAIQGELELAREKFPQTAHLMVALMEEVGELAQASLQGKPLAAIRREAIQVAAIAVRLITEGDSALAGFKAPA